MNSPNVDITAMLQQVAAGRREAADQLMELVYDQLHGLAQNLLRSEASGHTLQPTALVHEAYLRMAGQSQCDWRSKTHFLAIGAKMMRRILVDYARRKKRDKRGGGAKRLEFSGDLQVTSRNEVDILAVEEALTKLATLDARQAEIVELRFFGGLTVQETAEALGVSKRTVEAEWTMIRAWLRRELSGDAPT